MDMGEIEVKVEVEIEIEMETETKIEGYIHTNIARDAGPVL
jgi:hypothetical protein